ncbi:unnamed protein product [Dovyalis caffra]|uniref:RING-type domain-containing protein n=1 Tax=Dovyalis caffra TaxID=77055 RepID=A0AAV1RN53_9ROSI|nr:unnamed protein product [Dovyalis caffra]
MASSSSSCVIEEAQAPKIRVFKWNEKLRKDCHLQFVDKGLFLSTIKTLEISDYLTWCFRFQRDALITPSNSLITVFVAEISRTTTVENADETASSLFPPPWVYPSPLDDDLRNMDVDCDPSWYYDKHCVDSKEFNGCVHDIFPVKPIAVDQPIGLVQVLPETALQILHPLEDDGRREMLDDCPICLEDFSSSAAADVILKTPCSHIFHDKCIRQWLSKSHSWTRPVRLGLEDRKRRKEEMDPSFIMSIHPFYITSQTSLSSLQTNPSTLLSFVTSRQIIPTSQRSNQGQITSIPKSPDELVVKPFGPLPQDLRSARASSSSQG